MVIWFSVGVVVLFVLWASLTRLDEVASAPGVIVPSGQVQQIQHIEGGRIKEIMVRDGEFVEEDQVLMRLDALEHETMLQQAEDTRANLFMQRERLVRFTEGRVPKVVGSDAKQTLEHQLNEAMSQLAEINAREATLKSKQKIFKEEYSIAKDLNARGLLSRANLLALERQYTEIKGDAEQIPSQRAQINNKIAGFRDQAVIELESLENQIGQVQEEIRRRNRLVALSEIRAPASGVVLGLKTHTLGGVIASGDTILEIVPRNRKLMAEVRLSPADIGHVKVGQPVTIKFTSYDFSRYGGLQGTLEQISASTLVEGSGNPYFKGVVALAQETMGGGEGKLPILTGMTLIADIRTGDKTVMEYILKPIYASSAKALTER